MHQLTYTSCRPGVSLNGSGGYTVRAASSKLDPAWAACAPQLARYEVSSSKGAGGSRLAFHRRQNAAIVTHTVSVRDHESRQASFTHAIIDPTGQLGPTEAIGMWESPFWQRADDNGTTELPLVETLPANGALSWPSVQQRLRDERFCAMAAFLLSAWLRRTDKTIVLLADAEQVAAAIWLLTRCLPAPVLRELSFASQDHDPATAGVAVVGYGCATKSLPLSVLAVRHWFDLRTGERSGEGLESYAKFACGEILAGRWQTVETFLDLCSELRIDRADDIDLLHRVTHEARVCTEREILGVQDRPHLLRWLLQDQRHSETAVAMLTRGGAAAPRAGEALVAAFNETVERAEKLVVALLAQAGTALARKDLQRAAHLVNLCEGTKGAPAPYTIWQRAIEQIGVDQLAIDTRVGLAGVLKGLGSAGTNETLATRLLAVPLEGLPEALRCSAPASLKAEACRIVVDGAKAMTQSTIDALASQPEVLSLFLRTAADPTAVASVIAASEPITLLDVLVVDRAARSRIDVDAVMGHALEVGKLELRQLATTSFARFWEILLRGAHADKIVSEMLRLPATHYTAREITRHLRSALAVASISNAVSGAIHRRIRLLEAMEAPSAPIDFPQEVMAAIADMAPADQRTVALRLLPQLATSVAKGTPAVLCRELPVLMELAASLGHCGTATALREFAKAALANGHLLADAVVATVTVAYAFGATGCQPQSASARDQLIDLGVELVTLYARAGGPSLNRQVDERAMRWPEPARTLFRLARRQRRVNGYLWARFARPRAALAEAEQ